MLRTLPLILLLVAFIGLKDVEAAFGFFLGNPYGGWGGRPWGGYYGGWNGGWGGGWGGGYGRRGSWSRSDGW